MMKFVINKLVVVSDAAWKEVMHHKVNAQIRHRVDELVCQPGRLLVWDRVYRHVLDATHDYYINEFS